MIENLNNFYIYFILNKFFKLLTYFKKSLKKLWSQPGRTQIQMTRDFFGLGGVAIPPFSPFCFHSPSPSHFAFLFLTP